MGEWVRAKACSSHTCIEVRRVSTKAVGTSRDRELDIMSHLFASLDEWAAFVQGIKDGDFDHV